LEAYFAGDLAALDGVTTRTAGTEFQQQVWAALRTIPVGATASYGEIAAQIGQKGAARAVGAANNRNPVAIVIPCHRVIGANGALVGYGGGLERKLLLLRHEGAII
jgi:methylated-DNA-[protein]-cysteine S-methyltransferase